MDTIDNPFTNKLKEKPHRQELKVMEMKCVRILLDRLFIGSPHGLSHSLKTALYLGESSNANTIHFLFSIMRSDENDLIPSLTKSFALFMEDADVKGWMDRGKMTDLFHGVWSIPIISAADDDKAT